MSTPKKRRVILLAEKKAIIGAAQKESNKTRLAQQFDVPLTTVCRILKEKKQCSKQLTKAAKQSGRDSKLGNTIKWKKHSSSGTSKSQESSTSKRVIDKWTTSSIVTESNLKSEKGESGAVDVGSLREWQQQVLQDSLAGYSPDDIFNADETGLFWQLLPNKTMTMKGDKCIGGKKSKERITVLVCANMSGTEKLPLLVIGSSTKPRCFKNHKVPVDYEANKKAWMTGVLFEVELKKWDNKFQKNDRKVLLYLDNCSAHPPNFKLDNIKVKFFPPNTTALSKINQGVIQNLKVHYRKLLLRVRISEIEAGNNYQVSMLDSL